MKLRSPRSALALAAVVALLGTGTAACGTSGPGSGDKVTVWGVQEDTLNPVQEKSIKAYNAKGDHPEITYQPFANDPYKQKLRTALGSPKAPDVFQTWGGGHLATYVKAGDAVDLTPVFQKNPALKDKFLPAVLDNVKFDGKYYGIPIQGMQPVSIYYNKDVFAKAGISKPPATWDDLLGAIDKLKAKGIQPFALAGSQSWTELMWIEYLLDRIGGPEVFEKIQNGDASAWKDPAVLKSLNMAVDLVKRGAFGTNYGSVGQDDGSADALLSHGKAAMELMGSWEYAAQLGSAPEFVNGGKLGWAAFPTVPGGKGDPANIVGNPTNYDAINTKSKHKQAAQDFVTKTLVDPAYVKDLIKIGQVPPMTDVRPQLQAAPHADFTTYLYDLVKKTPHFQQSWDQALDPATSEKMLTNLQKVFAKQQTPEQFVAAMAG